MSSWRPARDHFPAKLCTPREHGFRYVLEATADAWRAARVVSASPWRRTRRLVRAPGRAARIGLSDTPAGTHTSRSPLQDLYSLTNSEILNLTWWIRASWWIRGSIVHQISPIARINHGNFPAYRFNKHSFTRRPCQRGTAPG